MSATDATIEERLLDYIARKREVSFDEIYDYMVANGLRFGAAANPIEILDLKGYETGKIDVDYDLHMIYVRHAATRAAGAATTAATAPGPR